MTPPLTPAKRTRTRLNETYVADPPESAAPSEISERATSITSLETADGVLTDATSPPESAVEKPSPEPEVLSPESTRSDLNVAELFKQEDMDDARAHCLANAIPFVPLTGRVAAVTSATTLEGVVSNAMAGPSQTQQPQVMISVEACDEPAVDPAAITRRKYQRRVYNKATTPPVSTARVPGDYTLTPLLLAQPEMAWIHCTICNTAFVQTDAYFTRSACPRCERHSKLYGYVWPKTEKLSPNDDDRVLDHRTVHRFLAAEDEAKIRGRKIPLWARSADEADDDQDNGDEAAEPEDARNKAGQDGGCVDGAVVIRRGRGRPRRNPEAPKPTQAKAEEEDDGALELGRRTSGRPRRLSARAASNFSL